MNAVVQIHQPAERPKTIEALAIDWLEAKKREADATKARVAIEAQIIALTGVREEGAQTHEAGPFKITVTGKLTRSIDWKQYGAIEAQIPEGLRPVTWKRELDETRCKYLQNNEPQIYALLARAITVKPAKTAVSVKRA